MQQEIANNFGITVNDVIEACRATDSKHRLLLLSQAAENWIDSGNALIGSKYAFKFFNDASLKDLLTADKIDLDKIQFLGTRYRLSQ